MRMLYFSPVAAQSGGGHHLRSSRTSSASNTRLNQLLYRLKAAESDTQTSTATTAPLPEAVDDRSYLSDEEASSLCAQQQEFLVRKRKAALGLGPIMPANSVCPCCAGFGVLTCHQCKGTGLNTEGKLDGMFASDVTVRILNGVTNLKWFLKDSGPCWLCKGLEHVACSDCSGTGIRGGVDRYTGD